MRCGPWFLLDGCGPRLHAPRLTNARTDAPSMTTSLARGRHVGTTSSQRPRHQGFDPMSRARHWRELRRRNGTTLGRSKGRVARGRRGDASFWRPSCGLPCGPLEAPACDGTTSVCGRFCRIRSRRAAIPSESSPSSSSFSSSSSGESCLDSPHASTWLSIPRALDARGSSSFPSSSPRPLRTFASLWRHAFSYGRRRPPSPEASRTGRRSSPVRISISLREIRKRMMQLTTKVE